MLKALSRRATFALAIATPTIVRAQPYPTRPIRFISPYAPGGTGDIMARLIATGVSAKLHQPVVVENRPGANGVIGADAVAKAAPDGYTYGVVVSSHTINKAVRGDMPFDPVTDFEPVCLAVRTQFALTITGNIPAATTRDFIDYARARPGQLSFASAGSGSNVHVFLEWFCRRAGIEATHVPYRGSGSYHTDLLAGRVQFTIDGYASFAQHFQSGALKLLAMGGPSRFSQRPDVPTIAEAAGIDGFEAGSWAGVIAPARTPGPILDIMNAAVVAVMQEAEVQRRTIELGADVTAGSRADFGRVLQTEATRFSALVQEFGITAAG
ncbi:tripartite tricarboxylate transporter substrate binding protein [Roseomonas hellenica]|uniref:Tripartite tricarboxylate transporter substrate binding protein n=1 Tax=Plastoroseomonas hellenica TaxID=2687306 RepID=A0ABS5F4V9_9PROT|nr:tripartite tricarboxylate transporter substrate binding protein [Plastoroseomonas hellenica]MBR0667576.1 tripartite tricarboxylate transporter substrate binding protein [Plastoroseomonas hellenica]